MSSFGRHRLADWMLDPAATYLNHGTVGATPRRVLARQQALRDEMERHPARFMLRELAPQVGLPRPGDRGRLRAAAADVAAFVGAAADDLVFVSNVTTGINAALRAMRFEPGDEIVMFDLAYGAIANAATAIAGPQGAVLVHAPLALPVASPQAALDALAAAITPRTRLAILDHVTATSAIVLPIAALVELAHARGVAVIVDGAHAPGAVPVDVAAIGADYYAANLHKWAWAPRSCGFLHAPAARQAGLHGAIVSWGLDAGLAAEFDWPGTFDPTPMLAAPEGLAMLRELGVAEVQAYNHTLAWRAATTMVEAIGATLVAPESMVGTMASVQLPARFGTTPDAANALRDRLYFEHGVEAHVQAFRDRVLLRVSGQIYNDDGDVTTLVAALRALA